MSRLTCPFVVIHLTFEKFDMGPTLFWHQKKAGAHDWEPSYSAERFAHWKTLMFLLTHALTSEQWVLPPSKIHTLAGPCDQELGYLGKGFTNRKILLCCLTQCLISEVWVLFPFIINAQAGTHGQALGLFRWRVIFRRFKRFQRKLKDYVWDLSDVTHPYRHGAQG